MFIFFYISEAAIQKRNCMSVSTKLYGGNVIFSVAFEDRHLNFQVKIPMTHANSFIFLIVFLKQAFISIGATL